jgi:hypothetical protein
MKTLKSVELPAALWQHALFQDSAEYPDAALPLTAARIDSRLRRIYHRPSTGDDTADQAVSALDTIYENARKTQLPHCPELQVQIQRWRLLQRLIESFSSGNAGRMELRMLDRLCAELVADGTIDAPPDPNIRIGDLIELLQRTELLLLDRIASTHPATQKSYIRRVYKAVEQAHAFNSTADTVRIEPVIRWIQHVLPPTPSVSARAYIDVGCSMNTGARNTLLAAQLLRPQWCDQIHGTDIVPPAPELKCTMLKQHRILLYHANPIQHPLPRRYDVILLANVHRHLTRADQESMLQNLGLSLRPNGLLFINWRFDQRRSPCLMLQRQPDCLLLQDEKNCIA